MTRSEQIFQKHGKPLRLVAGDKLPETLTVPSRIVAEELFQVMCEAIDMPNLLDAAKAIADANDMVLVDKIAARTGECSIKHSDMVQAIISENHPNYAEWFVSAEGYRKLTHVTDHLGEYIACMKADGTSWSFGYRVRIDSAVADDRIELRVRTGVQA